MLTRFRPLLLLAVAMLAGALALPAHALQFNYSTRLTLTDCNDADEAGFQSGLTMLCYDLTAGREEIWNGSAWVAYQGGGSSGGTTTTLIDGATATTSTSAAAASNGQGARVIGYATSGTYDATITVYGTNVDCGSSCSAASLGATSVGTITTDGGSVDDSNYLYHFALITAYTSGTISAKVVPTQAVYLWYGQANVSAANPLPVTLATTIAGEDQDGDTTPASGQSVLRIAPGNIVTITLMNGVTSTTTGAATRVYGGMKAVRAEGTDSGASTVAAAVEIYGSDESNTTAGLLLCSLTLSGTDSVADGCVIQAPWPYMWGKTTAVGSNDSVTVTVSQ